MNGNSTYITVLNSLQDVQTLELNLLQAQLLQAQYRASLYRALGGTNWGSQINTSPSEEALERIYGTEKPLDAFFADSTE